MFYYYNDIGNNLASNNKIYSSLILPPDIFRVVESAMFTPVTFGISLERLFRSSSSRGNPRSSALDSYMCNIPLEWCPSSLSGFVLSSFLDSPTSSVRAPYTENTPHGFYYSWIHDLGDDVHGYYLHHGDCFLRDDCFLSYDGDCHERSASWKRT